MILSDYVKSFLSYSALPEMLLAEMVGSFDNEIITALKPGVHPRVIVPRGIAQEQFGALLLKLDGRSPKDLLPSPELEEAFVDRVLAIAGTLAK